MELDLQQPLQELLAELIAFVPDLIVALITFAAALLLSQPAARAIRRVTRQRVQNEDTVRLLSRLARWSVIIVGTLAALDQVNFDVTGFVAGLGIAGITIGFALQDVASNFVAGLLLFARQPFQIGHAVRINDHSGIILDITTRDTVLRTWDGERVIIANTTVLENPIINYTESELRRRTIYVGLGYGQNVGEAIGVFVKALADVEGVLEDPAPVVQAEELGDATLNLVARFWLDTRVSNLLEVHSQAVIALDRTAEENGIDLPYPIQTVNVKKVD